MNIILKNEQAKVIFSTYGAEMISFQHIDDPTEYIWQADPAIWNRHAPVLFPIIGTLKDHEYTLDGKRYTIPPHGFARDNEFQVITQDASSVTFQLTNDDLEQKYLDMYPSPFSLLITYTLQDTTVTKTHTVTNTGDQVMYYQLGGHDAYAVALEEGEVMGDYYLDFCSDIPTMDMLRLHPESGKVTKSIRTHNLEHGTLSVPMERFYGDTLIIDQPAFDTVLLKSKKSSRGVSFTFENFNVMAFWSKKLTDADSNFVCIEPWSSLPDCHYLGKELELKEHIQILNPAMHKVYTFKTTFLK